MQRTQGRQQEGRQQGRQQGRQLRWDKRWMWQPCRRLRQPLLVSMISATSARCAACATRPVVGFITGPALHCCPLRLLRFHMHHGQLVEALM